MKNIGYKIFLVFSDYYGNIVSEDFRVKYFDLLDNYSYATYNLNSYPEDFDILCIEDNYDKVKEMVMNIKPDIIHSFQINSMAELISRELDIPHGIGTKSGIIFLIQIIPA